MYCCTVNHRPRSPRSTRGAAMVYFAIGDPTRRHILDLLLTAELSVTELMRPFRMSQPAVSQHLKVLRRAGLVRARRQGRLRLYRLNPKPVEQVYNWAQNYQRFRDPAGHVWGVGSQISEPLRQSPRTPESQPGFQIWLPSAGAKVGQSEDSQSTSFVLDRR